MASDPFIPVCAPLLGTRELEYVVEAVKTGWISSAGPFIAELEKKFAAQIGIREAVAVGNGTEALHVVLHSRGIGAGHEVIVPSQTFVATSAAVRYCGATPVFADIRRDTWTLDPSDVTRKLSPRTRAIIPVDLFGLCADVPLLRAGLASAGRTDVLLLEDAAEAFGSALDGISAGALGDVGVFSFYGNKTLTTGEGGMVVTNDIKLADRVRFLKDHAMSATKRYFHPEIGFNFRMTNLQAAVGLAQLESASDLCARKKRIHARYRAVLEKENGVHVQAVPKGHDFVAWLTTVVDDALPGEKERDLLIDRMRARGVDSRPMFYPNHLLPAFAADPFAGLGHLPVTEDVSFRALSLPSGAGLSDPEVDRCLEAYLTERRALV